MLSTADLATIRRAFPITGHAVYFDSARHTPLATPVRRALERFFIDSEIRAGPKAQWLDKVETVRERIARLICARADDIAFMKNTSEGLLSAALAIPFRAGDTVLLNGDDHPNTLRAFRHLASKGIDVREAGPVRGARDAETFFAQLDARPRAVALSHVSFDRGFRSDLAKIGLACAQAGGYFVVDAIQSAGVLPLDVAAANVSLAAFGCSKGLLCPPGLGVLYCRPAQPEVLPCHAASNDRQSQAPDNARRFEFGLSNLPAIHALDAALDFIEAIGVSEIADHVLDLSDYLRERMAALGVVVQRGATRETCSHINLLPLSGEAWSQHLVSHGIRFSVERDGMRISFAMFNTRDEVDRLAEAVRTALRAGATTLPAEVRDGNDDCNYVESRP